MAPLTIASRALARGLTRSSAATAVRALSTTAPQLDAASSSGSYSSPFKGETKGSKIPDFSKYTGGNYNTNLLFQYFMVGTMGAITAAGAKSTVQGALLVASVQVSPVKEEEVEEEKREREGWQGGWKNR